MKKFSLFLMIVLIVGTFFISCSAEPSADVADVANVAIDFPKALSAQAGIQSLPGAGTLTWKYTAVKNDESFITGQTTGETLIRADGEPGLPSVIGYNGNAESGTWFSTGNWLFSFFGYDSNNNLIYKAENVGVTVVRPEGNSYIGGTANIELTVANDTRTGAKFTVAQVTVDLGNSYSSGTYTLEVFVDDASQATKVIAMTSADAGVLTFGSDTATEIISYEKNSTGDHTFTFKVIKEGVTAPYATEAITLNARNGYTWTISGELANLDAVAWVGIDYTVLSISTQEDLRSLASYVNNGHTLEGKTVKLEHDITLTDAWTPIGNSYRGQDDGAYFAGTFDGQGYTISGLTDGDNYIPANAKSNGEYSYGLFGIVKNATIKNINLKNVDIKSNNSSYTADEVGAVVGYSLGSLTLENITVVSGSVVGDNVGGIIGRAYGTNTENEAIFISNCTNQAAVSSSHNHDSGVNSYTDRAAGIAGYINGKGTPVTVENCINGGNITVGSASGTGKKIIAGICCYGFNTGVTDSYTFTNNKSTGALTVLGTSGTVNIASIVFMCNELKETTDTYSFTDATDYTVGTITVYGETTEVSKETH